MAASKPVNHVAYFDATASQYEDIMGSCTHDAARYIAQLPSLASLFSSDAVVLDNAAGTGFVTEEIVRYARLTDRPIPHVCVVDAAPGMVSFAERKLANLGVADLCSTGVMQGENLKFPDGYFTHSITNFGVPFFNDDISGLREIHRTLKPRGIAVVSSWEARGLINMIGEAQLLARPNDEFPQNPFQEWGQPSYVESMMKDKAGFANVRIEKHEAYYGMPSYEQLEEMLVRRFVPQSKNWSAGEQAIFRAVLKERVTKDAEAYTMLNGQPGFGIPMTAIVGIGEA